MAEQTEAKKAEHQAFIKSKSSEIQSLARVLWGELAGVKTPRDQKTDKWQAERKTYIHLARRVVSKLHTGGIQISGSKNE